MRISKSTIITLFFPFLCLAQTLTGRVIDKITQQPIETVSVYFNNTTIGTTTNSDGEFSISYTDAIQSVLVISYLGYEKVLISDYRNSDKVLLELVEENNALDEVYLNYDDGLTRRQKLRLFRKEFLGASKFGRSCKVLNEADLVLKYDKYKKALYASSSVPLKIINKSLKYEISYELMDFEILFRYVNLKSSQFTINAVTYYGTSFFKDVSVNKKKSIKKRDQVYQGSIQHFIRALYYQNLREEGYWIFHDKFRVEEWEYFTVEVVNDEGLKKITLKEKVSILFQKKNQSKIQLKIPEFYVDAFGNYTPIVGVYFSGDMGDQRVGDTLPLDYGLVEN